MFRLPGLYRKSMSNSAKTPAHQLTGLWCRRRQVCERIMVTVYDDLVAEGPFSVLA